MIKLWKTKNSPWKQIKSKHRVCHKTSPKVVSTYTRVAKAELCSGFLLFAYFPMKLPSSSIRPEAGKEKIWDKNRTNKKIIKLGILHQKGLFYGTFYSMPDTLNEWGDISSKKHASSSLYTKNPKTAPIKDRLFCFWWNHKT